MPKRDKAPRVVSLDQVLKLLQEKRDKCRAAKRRTKRYSLFWLRAEDQLSAVDDLIVEVRKLTSYRGAARMQDGTEQLWTF